MALTCRIVNQTYIVTEGEDLGGDFASQAFVLLIIRLVIFVFSYTNLLMYSIRQEQRYIFNILSSYQKMGNLNITTSSNI